MLITRECDYAVRVVRALNGESRLSVNEICEREDITAPFAYKILKKLQKADLVAGFRGVHGGYALSKSLSEISLLDIYLAIDPDLFIIECLDPRKPCSRDGGGDDACRVHKYLGKVQRELREMLAGKSLEEIMTQC